MTCAPALPPSSISIFRGWRTTLKDSRTLLKESRIISRTYGEQSVKAGSAPSDLGDEIADVLFVLVCIANQTGVDLESAISKNLQKKTDRDALRHRNNPKLSS